MQTFIEKINKLAVDTGDGSPKIIGSDLVILEFKDFIRKLNEDVSFTMNNSDYNEDSILYTINERAGCNKLENQELNSNGGKNGKKIN